MGMQMQKENLNTINLHTSSLENLSGFPFEDISGRVRVCNWEILLIYMYLSQKKKKKTIHSTPFEFLTSNIVIVLLKIYIVDFERMQPFPHLWQIHA